MDRLAALRAPLAVAALAALTLVAAARMGLGLSELGAGGSRAVAAARLAPNASDGSLTVLVAVLVVACFAAPAVPARRGLAVWGAVLTGLSLVATVVALSLTSAEVAGWSLVWLVPEVTMPAVVGVGLVALARRPADAYLPAGTAASGAGAPVEDEASGDEPEPQPDPELQPGWTQDSAAGAVWRTAGEAARGEPASGWGSVGGTAHGSGWAPRASTGSSDSSAPGVGGVDPSGGWGRPPALPPSTTQDPADR